MTPGVNLFWALLLCMAAASSSNYDFGCEASFLGTVGPGDTRPLAARTFDHGLRTPNEGINRRYLKNWADVADKICFGRT